MLRFKTDENMPAEVAQLLIAAGHDALTVPDQKLGGKSDPDVAAVCKVEGRAIVTLDLDFGDIRAYPPAGFAGIIVLRLSRLDKPRILTAVRRLLPVLSHETPVGKLWIVDEARVRVRS
jgi:predicted nuclease of predicted toxin-antitoxin system